MALSALSTDVLGELLAAAQGPQSASKTGLPTVTYTGGGGGGGGGGHGNDAQDMTSEAAQRDLQHSMFLPIMFRRSGVAHSHSHQASVHWTSNTALVDLNMLVQFKPGSLLHDQRLYLDRIAHLERLTSSINPAGAGAGTGDGGAGGAEAASAALSANVPPRTNTTTSTRGTKSSSATKWREPLGYMVGNAFSVTLASALDTDFKHYQSAIFARFNAVCHTALSATAAVTTAMSADRGQTYQPSGQAKVSALGALGSAAAASSKETGASAGAGAMPSAADARSKSRELVVDVARDVERGLKDYLKGVLQVRVTLLDAGTGPDGSTEVFYDTVTYALEAEAVLGSGGGSGRGGVGLAGKRAQKTLLALQAAAADPLSREVMGGQRGDVGTDGTLLEGHMCVARLPVGAGSRATARDIRGSITLWGAHEQAEVPVYNPKADVCPFMHPWVLYKEASFDVTHAPAAINLDTSSGGARSHHSSSGTGGGNIVASDMDDVYVIDSNFFNAHGGGAGRARQGSSAAVALQHVNGEACSGSGSGGGERQRASTGPSDTTSYALTHTHTADTDTGLNETIRLHLTTTQLALARLLRALASAFGQRCNDIVSTDLARTRLGTLVGKHGRSKGMCPLCPICL